jgi:hypothetical protein
MHAVPSLNHLGQAGRAAAMLAGKLSSGDFGLLQQYLPQADIGTVPQRR